jgi:hypothetical protein
MNLWRELPRRWSNRLRTTTGSLVPALSTAGAGARRGLALWRMSFASLLRSRLAGIILGVEILALAVAMVALWSAWSGGSPGLEILAMRFLKLLPVAVLAAALLPGLALVAACAAGEMARRPRKRVGP